MQTLRAHGPLRRSLAHPAPYRHTAHPPSGTRNRPHAAHSRGGQPPAMPPPVPHAAPHGPSGRPECSGLRPSLRPTSTYNQLVSTILHFVRTRTTIIYPGRPESLHAAPSYPRRPKAVPLDPRLPRSTRGGPRLPHALPVNPGQPRSAPCAPSRPRPTMARTHLPPPFSGARAPITHHYRQPHTMNATKNGNHVPAATSGHAGPFTLAHPRCRDALFRSVPPPCPPPSAPWYRTRKGPPPCGSGPCCIMHRAGVSPARSRAGARPARQGR